MTKDREIACRYVRAAVGAAGGTGAAAAKCGLKPTTVSGWMARGRVPRWHIAKLCAAGGNVVSKADLRDAMMNADASEDADETRGEI